MHRYMRMCVWYPEEHAWLSPSLLSQYPIVQGIVTVPGTVFRKWASHINATVNSIADGSCS